MIITLRRLTRANILHYLFTEDMAADIPETLAYYDQLGFSVLCRSFLPIREHGTGSVADL